MLHKDKYRHGQKLWLISIFLANFSLFVHCNWDCSALWETNGEEFISIAAVPFVDALSLYIFGGGSMLILWGTKFISCLYLGLFCSLVLNEKEGDSKVCPLAQLGWHGITKLGLNS